MDSCRSNLLVLQVKGRSDLFLKLEVVKKVALSVILIIAFFYGFYALLWGQLIFSIVALLINTHYAGRMLEYSVVQQLKDIAPVFAFAIVMGVVTYFVANALRDFNNISQLLVAGLSGGVTYLIVAHVFNFESIKDIKNLIVK
jgi:teichuronic acid exporter